MNLYIFFHFVLSHPRNSPLQDNHYSSSIAFLHAVDTSYRLNLLFNHTLIRTINTHFLSRDKNAPYNFLSFTRYFLPSRSLSVITTDSGKAVGVSGGERRGELNDQLQLVFLERPGWETGKKGEEMKRRGRRVIEERVREREGERKKGTRHEKEMQGNGK